MPEFLRPVLADCLQHGIRIVSNFGAANPPAQPAPSRLAQERASARRALPWCTATT
jgi:hypothetical protein